jgi:AbiJ N-terminal domain 5
MSTNRERAREILELANQVEAIFDQSDWIELGYIVGENKLIEGHSRLLRSLSWGDEDYKGNVLEVLTKIIDASPENFQDIKDFIQKKNGGPEVSEFISTGHVELPKKIISFSPYVFQVPEKSQNEKLVSVMLPFNLNDTFETVKTACSELSLDCKKADDIWINSTFIQDIFELIFTSKIVIADFTGKNPNVFYEVGIAHTLGKTVIPISQSIDDVPSDLRHHRVLKYLPNQEGYSNLKDELVKRIKTIIPDSTSWF